MTIGFEGVLEEVDSKSIEDNIYRNNTVAGLDVTSSIVGKSDAPKPWNRSATTTRKLARDTVGQGKVCKKKNLSVSARIFRLLNSILTRPSKNNRRHITRACEAQGLGWQDG